MSGGFLLFFLVAIIARMVFFGMRHRGEGPKHALPPPNDPRWASRVEDQIAGRACGHCTRKIVTDAEGKTCKRCGILLHRRACAKEHRVHAHATNEVPYR